MTGETSLTVWLLGSGLGLLAAPAWSADAPSPGDASAPSGYYAGVHGGINHLSQWNPEVRLGLGVVLEGNVDLEAKHNLGVQLGRQTESARFELEYQRGTFGINRISLGPVSESADEEGHYTIVTVNAYRTARLRSDLNGYVGIGIGYGRATMPTLRFSSGCECFAAASGSGLSYLARVGAEYRINEHSHGFVQITALSVPGPASDGDPGISYPRKAISTVSLGYRHLF